ncbi:MAG: hypothetical protein ACRCST_06895 [Turicibacter sp.]
MSHLNIPFLLNDKKGLIEVVYEKNTSISKSGFDMLKHLNFDLNICIGYPTVHAYVKETEASGDRRLCGWIQILELEYFKTENSVIPDSVKTEVDCLENISAPFFSYGYPAQLYDGDQYKLNWKARTYLVTVPEPSNNETISLTSGFQWGYTEKMIRIRIGKYNSIHYVRLEMRNGRKI